MFLGNSGELAQSGAKGWISGRGNLTCLWCVPTTGGLSGPALTSVVERVLWTSRLRMALVLMLSYGKNRSLACGGERELRAFQHEKHPSTPTQEEEALQIGCRRES